MPKQADWEKELKKIISENICHGKYGCDGCGACYSKDPSLTQTKNLIHSLLKKERERMVEEIKEKMTIFSAHDAITIARREYLSPPGLAYQGGWIDGQNDLLDFLKKKYG